MRTTIVTTLATLMLGLAGGCASQPNQGEASAPLPIAQLAESDAEPMATASALAFDPPVTIGQDMPDVSREPRQASAFLGYDSQTTTYFSIHTEDRQTSGGGYGFGRDGGIGGGSGFHDYYDRRTYIDTSGSRTR